MARRLVALVMGALLVAASFAAPVSAVDRTKLTARPLGEGTVVEAAKSRSGAIAKSDPALLARTDAAMVSVLVKLDVDAVASYDGRLEGLAATSPSVTGKALQANGRAVRAYEAHLIKEVARTAAAIEASVPAARVGTSLTTAYGGLSVRLPANRAKELLRVDGVVAVQADALLQPTGTTSVDFIGAPQAWASLGGSDTAGEGVIVGVLDTGIWPEHPMLADPGIDYDGPAPGCEFGNGTDPALGPAFTCNDKLIGAYAFTDTYVSVFAPLAGEYCNLTTLECSARDANGHGTHTATTAAGAGVDSAPILGIDRGPASGVAPGAHVIGFRVCLQQGCFQSDSISAVEQAITDGVDVINFSVSGGSNAFTDPVELAFLDAYAAGISVNASAGNAGPGAATADHAGPWVTTVGASTYDHMYLSTLVLTAAGGATFEATGSTIVPGLTTPTPVVLGSQVTGEDRFCSTAFTAGSVAGKVVVCERGVTGRNVKSFNVLAGGAVGMILYNPTLQSLFTDNFFVPTIMLEGPQPGLSMVDFVEDHSGVMARWETGTVTGVTPDTMAQFSSRGPLGDFLKPDVTAPGLQILAGNTPTPVDVASGPPGQLFQAIAGTSMSSPHSAGVSALVKAAYPDWSPGQIKSALMTSSIQSVLKEDGTPADPWDRGAGSIRADRALAPTVTLDVEPDDYFASVADAGARIDLNLPSVNVNTMAGAVDTTRTVTNVSGRTEAFRVVTSSPAGTTINVSPRNFTLGPGQSMTLTISIAAPAAANGWYFGSITLDARRAGATDAYLPVAFQRTQGSVTLTHACDATDLARNESTDCTVEATNLAPVPADVSLSLSAPPKLVVSDVSAPATPSGNGFTWQGTLTPALAPTIDAITDAGGASPGGGYLPLELFGVGPEPGFADETIVNYDVPSFRFGTEVYGRVGVDSNGYVVVGGGTADDNDCCNPQTLPDPARPNNVLAPFWTDLNPAHGGVIRAAILTDGTTDWLIVEWDAVVMYGTTTANTFQIWIQLGESEGIWFTYGPMGGPAGNPFTIGAENRDGSSGVNLGGLPTAADYVIETSPPLPGGSAVVEYSVASKHRGTYAATATLVTDLVRGVTTEVVSIRVR